MTWESGNNSHCVHNRTNSNINKHPQIRELGHVNLGGFFLQMWQKTPSLNDNNSQALGIISEQKKSDFC